MKIRQRRDGGWCMEHEGVEAPYIVTCHAPGKFSVIDVDDEDQDEPPHVAHLEDAETCERLTWAHYQPH